jgi:orotidine-5'-phosphate decarboxylase
VTIKTEEKLILALDVSDYKEALDIVDNFQDAIKIYKVGLELFTSQGPKIIKELTQRGKQVFLDLKFHDIPNTVSRAAVTAVRHGITMFTIHTSGGEQMLRACAESVVSVCLKENIPRPKLLGVTVLTSIDQNILRDELGSAMSLSALVRALARMAFRSGLDGVVASAQEIVMIREHLGDKFLIVTPGIRPSWSPPNDQKRTMTPKQALRAGADYIVMGRSIIKQPHQLNAMERIFHEISSV